MDFLLHDVYPHTEVDAVDRVLAEIDATVSTVEAAKARFAAVRHHSPVQLACPVGGNRWLFTFVFFWERY